MPAYLSVESLLDKNIIYPNFVKDVYTAFFKMGYKFKSGYWVGADMRLEQIIEWNQKLLEKRFRLGLKQHVKHDYRQILLETDLYDEIRLFWMYLDCGINLTLLVPESNVINDVCECKYISEKITPLIDISCSLWETGFITLIQSCTEIEGIGVSVEQVKKGKVPNTNPFSIVSQGLVEKYLKSLSDKMKVRKIKEDGILLIRPDLLFD